MRGEDDERERLRGSLFDLRSAWHAQTRGQGNLSLLTRLARLPGAHRAADRGAARYLAGEIQLGGLMQTAQAFSSVQWALSWLIDNFPKVADWRASTDRVVHLHMALLDLEESVEGEGERITLHEPTESDSLIMRELGLARPPTARCWWRGGNRDPAPRTRTRSAASPAAARARSCWRGRRCMAWGRGSIQLPKGRHHLHAAEAPIFRSARCVMPCFIPRFRRASPTMC